jgi:HSP20 family protein
MSTTLATRLSQAQRPLVSQDPFGEFRKQMRDVVNQFQPDWNGNDEGLAPAISPSVDLSETTDGFQIRMDVPGIKAEEIDIEVSGDTVRIDGEHKAAQQEKGRTFHRAERRTGTFARVLTLPATVKEGLVTAEVADGVLTITLPKTEVTKTQKVLVKTAGK